MERARREPPAGKVKRGGKTAASGGPETESDGRGGERGRTETPSLETQWKEKLRGEGGQAGGRATRIDPARYARLNRKLQRIGVSYNLLRLQQRPIIPRRCRKPLIATAGLMLD